MKSRRKDQEVPARWGHSGHRMPARDLGAGPGQVSANRRHQGSFTAVSTALRPSLTQGQPSPNGSQEGWHSGSRLWGLEELLSHRAEGQAS